MGPARDVNHAEDGTPPVRAERSLARALGWAAMGVPLALAVVVPLGLLVIAPMTPIAAGLGSRGSRATVPGWGAGWLAYCAGAVPLLLNIWSLIHLCGPSDLTILHTSLRVAALVLAAGTAVGGYLGSARVWVGATVLYAVTFAVVFTVQGGPDLEMVC
jgi:hypothetical protein